MCLDRSFLKNNQQFLDYLNHENNIEATKEERFKRKRKTIEALTKYNDLKVAEVDSQYFGWIPNSWLERGLSSQAYGLLVLIVIHSAPVPYYQKQIAVIGNLAIRRLLGLNNANRKDKINDLLYELETSEIIVVHDNFIELNREGTSNYQGTGFTKVYVSTVKKILEHMQGMKVLNVLASYLALRSTIFENKTSGNLPVTMGSLQAWASGKVSLSPRVHSDNLKWLREHDILAWVEAIRNNAKHNSCFYYSELWDAESIMYEVLASLSSRILRLAS